MKKFFFSLAVASLFFLCSLSQTVLGELPPPIDRLAQEKLSQTGFDPGPVDGVLGPKSREAIRQFQAHHGLSETGLLDLATIKALGVGEEKEKTPEIIGIVDLALPYIQATFTQVKNNPDLARLILLVVLGLASLGFRNWLVSTIIGSMVAFGLHKGLGWSLPFSFLVVLGAIYVLPLLFRYLWLNFRMTLVFTIIFGVPAFLISRFTVGSTLIYAVADSIALMHLVPAAVIGTLIKTDFIKLAQKPQKLSVAGTKPSEPKTYPTSTWRSESPRSGGASSPITSR